MAVSEQPVRLAEEGGPLREVRRTGRWSGFAHLLGARLLEMKREPEVIFWVFGFPILLALGLGIAFRNKPADVTVSGDRCRSRSAGDGGDGEIEESIDPRASGRSRCRMARPAAGEI